MVEKNLNTKESRGIEGKEENVVKLIESYLNVWKNRFGRLLQMDK